MKPTKEMRKQWHQDPANWKLGMFYFNPADKRIFPPKKNKYMGWTVNFANPLSILSLILMIVVIVFVSNWLQQTL